MPARMIDGWDKCSCSLTTVYKMLLQGALRKYIVVGSYSSLKGGEEEAKNWLGRQTENILSAILSRTRQTCCGKFLRTAAQLFS